MFRFRSLLCVVCLSLSLSLFVLSPLVLVLVSAQSTANLLEVGVDQISATTARIRFLNAQPALQTLTLIQYTTDSGRFGSLSRDAYHDCKVFDPACPSGTVLTSDDHEVNITQGALPITNYILRGLKPQTTYHVRVAYIDKSSQAQTVGTAGARSFLTRALSPDTWLSSLVASGGCGSLSSSSVGVISSMYNLTHSLVGSERIYHCSVVHDITSVSLSVIGPTPYSPITAPGISFNRTIQPLTDSAQVPDPFVIYTHNITLAGQGQTTNFSFIVNSEVSGVNQTHTLSIRRVPISTTSILRGPTTPVTAMIRTPSIPASYDYRALLWDSTSVSASSWKVWSDDFTIFPFSSFNITFPHTTDAGDIDYTFLRVLVTPSAAHSSASECSNIHIGLFPSNVDTSYHTTTCITALKDTCSTQPAGVATAWPTFYDENGIALSQLWYQPPPPTPTFPKAANIQ